jgi:L-seryl-tRNA(Ser) seleniumtransferase
VCYSGGKGLRGPYSAGLLLGRKDLVEYAKQHGSPNHRAYGRSMKVAPEEYLGMMIAVETSLKYDEKAEFNRQRKTVKFMQAQLAIIPGITITINQPDFEASEPYIEIQWDKRYQITPKELKEKLRHGTPSIEIRALFLSQGNIHLTAVMLTMSEAQIVVQRINTILQKSLIES